MDLEKRYNDSQGNKCNILEIVKREPEWAANRIQEGEKGIKYPTNTQCGPWKITCPDCGEEIDPWVGECPCWVQKGEK